MRSLCAASVSIQSILPFTDLISYFSYMIRVQMYYDMRKTRNERQLRRYMSWKRAMLDVLHSIPESRLVVLEIGCGTNVKTCDASPLLRGILTGEKVPTVRVESEELLAKSEEGRCTLIRINLDYPKCHWRPHLQKNTISIQASALRALHEIDQQLACPSSTHLDGVDGGQCGVVT